VAFVIEKGMRCTMCGTASWEWEQNRYAYEPTTKVCRGCEIRESVSDQTPKHPGLTVELAPTVGLEAAKRQMAQQKRMRVLAGDKNEGPPPIPIPVTKSMA